MKLNEAPNADPQHDSPVSMRLAVALTVIVAAAYYGLLLLGAFAGPLLARPIYGAIPLSFALGIGFIVEVVSLTALYAWRANAAESPP